MTTSCPLEMLKEAEELIKTLAPPQAPETNDKVGGIGFPSGLRVMKNEHLPDDTLVLSKRLFELVYESSKPYLK